MKKHKIELEGPALMLLVREGFPEEVTLEQSFSAVHHMLMMDEH